MGGSFNADASSTNTRSSSMSMSINNPSSLSSKEFLPIFDNEIIVETYKGTNQGMRPQQQMNQGGQGGQPSQQQMLIAMMNQQIRQQ